MIPFSLIVSRTPLVIWTTSPLVPLLFPWSSTIPVSAVARGSSSRFGPFASRPTLWPPPPALVCALFPIVRVLYGRLRERIIRMMVQDIIPTRTQTQAARQRQQQRGVQQEQQLRGNQQQRLQQLRIQLRARQQQQQQQQPQQPQQQQQQQQMPAGPGAGRRFQFQVGELFGFEIAHFVFDRHPPAPGDPVGPAPARGPAPAVAVVDDAANGGDGRAVDNPADRQQQPHRDGPVQEPERGLPADQDDPQQQQQRPPPEQQRAEPGQGQEPVPPARDEDDLGAVAARAIRVTGASLGRLVGGALLMPSIARMMGSMLLHISHVVPLIRIIIAPLPPPLPRPPFSPPSGPISTLVGLIRGVRADTVQVGYHGDGHGWLGGSSVGALVLRGLLATSQEWATSDPVWYVSFSVVYFSLSTHVFFTLK
jgi:hypothetical protein